MKAIGWITTFFAVICGAALWRGYVLSVLWRWFIASQFGLPVLTIGQAIGVGFICTFVFHHQRDSHKDERKWADKFAEILVWAFLWPLAGLAFGALYTLFL